MKIIPELLIWSIWTDKTEQDLMDLLKFPVMCNCVYLEIADSMVILDFVEAFDSDSSWELSAQKVYWCQQAYY